MPDVARRQVLQVVGAQEHAAGGLAAVTARQPAEVARVHGALEVDPACVGVTPPGYELGPGRCRGRVIAVYPLAR